MREANLAPTSSALDAFDAALPQTEAPVSAQVSAVARSSVSAPGSPRNRQPKRNKPAAMSIRVPPSAGSMVDLVHKDRHHAPPPVRMGAEHLVSDGEVLLENLERRRDQLMQELARLRKQHEMYEKMENEYLGTGSLPKIANVSADVKVPPETDDSLHQPVDTEWKVSDSSGHVLVPRHAILSC